MNIELSFVDSGTHATTVWYRQSQRHSKDEGRGRERLFAPFDLYVYSGENTGTYRKAEGGRSSQLKKMSWKPFLEVCVQVLEF